MSNKIEIRVSEIDGEPIDEQDVDTLVEGMKFVNRLGYIVCNVPRDTVPMNLHFIFDGSITDTDEVISITEDELNRTANRIRLQSVLSDIRKESGV